MAKSAKKTTEVLDIQELVMREIRFNVLGASPMIMNRFSQKAWQELLFPSARENRAGLEQSLKHDPHAEFRGAVYRNRDPKSKSLIHIPNGAFHGALASAALDIPGAAKSKMERQTSIIDTNIELFGLPRIFCTMVRNSDMNRTPDVRTRPIFPEWACRITVRYLVSTMSERTVANMLGASGQIVGIGDWRPQKGGPYGCFKLVEDGNKNFNHIIKTQGRLAQQHALDHPVAFDTDTEELLAWFHAEVRRREMGGKLKSQAIKPPGKTVIVNARNGGENFIGAE